jgi:DNA repair exonuclease SbcCD nuclease subunit
MFQKILALNNFWMRRLSDQINFKDDLMTARLREMSIPELKDLIERVKALELEKEMQSREREEERTKKEREEEMRQTKIKLVIESRFGPSSFFKDFFANRM